jgi:hypothetical protein
MKRAFIFFCFAWGAFGFSVAEARVFNITKESFASYLLFNAGTSSVGKSTYEGEASSGTSYDSDLKYNYGGEFGFLYATPGVNFRFGFEVIKPQAWTAQASDAGVDQYSVKSDLVGYAPKFGIEFNLRRGDWYRVYGLGSVGAANVSLKNSYTFTTTGQSTYPGVDSSIESKGSATEYYGGLGVEMHMSDTTTFVAEAGYRSLKFAKLTYTKATTAFDGVHASGDTVKDAGGNNRTLDFSGVLATIGFRFYL